jgi:tight adherence protein C
MTPEAVAIGGLFGAAVLLVAASFAMSTRMDPARARLGELGATQARDLEELELQEPFLERTLRPILDWLSRFAGRFTSDSFVRSTAKQLAMAGNPGAMSVTDWLGLKLLCALLTAAGVFVFALIARVAPVMTLLLTAAGFGIAYIAPEFWLRSKVRTRQRLILRAMPDALDLLTISVRAGLGFDAALVKVVERTEGPLSEEFRRAAAELRLGRARRDVLRDIIPRTEVRALSAFIGAILQAEQLGVSVSKVLSVQSEQLRVLRRQRAEELARTAPIKMLFPLIGCIFPSLFIVILGPSMILIMRGFGG